MTHDANIWERILCFAEIYSCHSLPTWEAPILPRAFITDALLNLAFNDNVLNLHLPCCPYYMSLPCCRSNNCTFDALPLCVQPAPLFFGGINYLSTGGWCTSTTSRRVDQYGKLEMQPHHQVSQSRKKRLQWQMRLTLRWMRGVEGSSWCQIVQTWFDASAQGLWMDGLGHFLEANPIGLGSRSDQCSDCIWFDVS